MRIHSFTSCAAIFFCVAYTSGAHALEGSAAVLGGFGPSPSQADDAFPPVGYGLGLGARAGVTLFDVYVGGTFVHQFGTTYDGKNSNVWYTGAEAGYAIHASQLTIRPFIGAGYARTHLEGPLWCATTSAPCHPDGRSASMGALWPGVTAIADLGNRFFAGLEARYVILLNGNYENAPSFFVTTGFAF